MKKIRATQAKKGDILLYKNINDNYLGGFCFLAGNRLDKTRLLVDKTFISSIGIADGAPIYLIDDLVDEKEVVEVFLLSQDELELLLLGG